ncbi:hypothetical protein HaLaN_00153, partial [Haematococcus lacustris]
MVNCFKAAHDLGIGSSTAQPPSGLGLRVLGPAGAAAGGSPPGPRPHSRLSLQWASSVSQSSYTSTLVQPPGSGGEGSNTTQTTPSPPRPWLLQRPGDLLTPGQLVTPSEPTPLHSPGSAYESAASSSGPPSRDSNSSSDQPPSHPSQLQGSSQHHPALPALLHLPGLSILTRPATNPVTSPAEEQQPIM